jgi:ankyrin repeat protein
MKAAANGHLDVVALLAAEGADLDHKDARMKTARDYAATHGHSPVVLFLAAQADRPALQDSPESS